MTKVFSTTNYDTFHHLKGNRDVVEGHVKNLSKSILANNKLKYNPAIVTPKMGIIDGQHRLEVCKRNKLPFFYTVLPQGSLEDTKTFNAYNKPWKPMDFVDSYIKTGVKDYEILKDYCESTGVPLGLAGTLLSASGNSKGSVMSAIKTGQFKVTNLKEAVQFGEVYRLYIPFTERGVAKDRSLIVAILRIQKVEGFEHERLLYKLDRFGIRIPQMANVKAYIRFLEDVYNFKQKTERIRFF